MRQPSSSPDLSIIVACRNEERFIAECLESLDLATNTSWEVIVIDDCSTDNSRKLIEVFSRKLPNVSYHCLDENVGLGAVRNFGMLLAKGRYMAFLDGDDVILADGMRAALKRIEDDQADILTSPLLRLTAGGATMDAALQGSFSGPEAFACYLKREFGSWSACMSIYDRRYVIKNSCIFQTGFFYEDVLFGMRAFFMAKVVSTTDVPFYVYRCIHDSITRGMKEGYRHALSSARLYYDIIQFMSTVSGDSKYNDIITTAVNILLADHLPKVERVLRNVPVDGDWNLRELTAYLSCRDSPFSKKILEWIAT